MEVEICEVKVEIREVEVEIREVEGDIREVEGEGEIILIRLRTKLLGVLLNSNKIWL